MIPMIYNFYFVYSNVQEVFSQFEFSKLQLYIYIYIPHVL